jgi:tetratricopeptide (TPR) repeat protein
MGYLEEVEGNLAEAREKFAKAYKLDPELSQALLHQGLMEARTGSLESAAKTLELAVQRLPTAPALNNLGTVYAERGDLKKAVDSFRTALRVDPSFELARHNLEKGDRRRANSSLTIRIAALRSDPKTPLCARDNSRRKFRLPPENRNAIVAAWGETKLGQPMTLAIKKGESDTDSDTNQSSDRAEDHRFCEKLHSDIAAPRPDGHADSDFTRSFSDGDQHDVHDADTTHQQRYRSNAAKKECHDARCLFRCFGNFREVVDAEVVVLTGSNAMPFSKKIGDLVLRWSCRL